MIWRHIQRPGYLSGNDWTWSQASDLRNTCPTKTWNAEPFSTFLTISWDPWIQGWVGRLIVAVHEVWLCPSSSNGLNEAPEVKESTAKNTWWASIVTEKFLAGLDSSPTRSRRAGIRVSQQHNDAKDGKRFRFKLCCVLRTVQLIMFIQSHIDDIMYIDLIYAGMASRKDRPLMLSLIEWITLYVRAAIPW